MSTPILSHNPNPTPSTDQPSNFSNPTSTDSSLVEDVLDPTNQFIDTASLTSTDIISDPILSSLAKQQRSSSATPTARTGTASTFKARPAPSNMRDENAGPRMTKSAALRQGLKWEGNGGTSSKGRPQTSDGIAGRPAGFGSTPGHKREGSSFNIASLASPSMAPRQTKASQLRTGEITSPIVEKDRAAMAVANKARDHAERLQRRKSVALPTSLSAPQIAPRGNRSSELRTGGPPTTAKPPPSSFHRPTSALTATSAINVAKPKEEPAPNKKDAEIKVSRRASVIGIVKSLGAPSIAPRLNKAAMLRAPPTSSAVTVASSNSNHSAMSPPPPRPTPAKAPSVMSIKSGLSDRVAPSLGPRPTKSSLLRAKFGGKVPAS